MHLELTWINVLTFLYKLGQDGKPIYRKWKSDEGT